MRVLVFSTHNPKAPENGGPFVMIPEIPEAFLPAHPDGLEWAYFVTTTLDDTFLLHCRAVAEPSLAADGFFIFQGAIGQNTIGLKARAPIEC